MARTRTPSRKRRFALKRGKHRPAVSLDQRIASASVVTSSSKVGRSSLGIMDESNGTPSWFSYQQ